MKILVAAGDGHDPGDIIQGQRKSTLAQLRELTKTKAQSKDLRDLILLERQIFQLDAQSRWLDHIEASAKKIAAEPKTQAA